MNKLESEELDSTTFYGLPVHTDHLAARGKSPTAFNRCCIPPRGVAPQSNTPSILPRRALGPGPRTGLDATPDFHHGLLVTIIKQAKERDDQRGRGRQWP